jgi:hypothetical protein
VILSLPFSVSEEESLVFASINVFSQNGRNVYLQISKDDPKTTEYSSWKVKSIPGKYWSYIEPVSLTKGSYYFSVIQDAN